MAVGVLPHRVEPYADWEVGQEVVVYSSHTEMRRELTARRRSVVKRLTKTLVVLEDDSRWDRGSGADATSARYEYSIIPDPYIVPLTDEALAELRQSRMAIKLVNRLGKINIYALPSEKLAEALKLLEDAPLKEDKL